MAVDWSDKKARSDASTFVRAIRTTLVLSRSEWKTLSIAFAAIMTSTALNIAFPYTVKLVIDRLPCQIGRLLPYFGLMVALQIASILVDQFGAKRNMLDAIIRLENAVPVICHEKMLELPVSYHERNGTSRNVAKITKGCDRMVNVLANLYFGLFPTLVYWMLNLILLLWIDWRLAAFLLLPLVPAFWLHERMFSKSLPLWEDWDSHKERATAHLFQSVVNVQTVQSYVMESSEISAQTDVRRYMERVDLDSMAIQRRYYTGIGSLIQLGYTAAIIAGISFVTRSNMTVGTLAFVIATGNVVVSQFGNVLNIYRMVVRDSVSVERMSDFLHEQNELPRLATPIPAAPQEQMLTFDNVSFRYGGKETNAVSNVSLSIPSGNMIAFVGKSGGGKTTLIKLLSRTYDPTDGAVRLNGTDVRTLDRDWYRRQFAVVRQQVDLFDATVKANVSYGNPRATDAEIAEAIRAAHLETTLADPKRFPEGLATLVGERGVRLSGGEQQRVGIARAYLHLLRGARFLILDEATSNLDSEAEYAIQQMTNALRRTQGKTIVVIAHRLSTVKSADRIYVVDGTIRESGTHRELLSAGGIYAKLVDRQDLHDAPASRPNARLAPIEA